jgi:hypothetical protein
MSPKGVSDTKTDRPTDRRSQHQLKSRTVNLTLPYSANNLDWPTLNLGGGGHTSVAVKAALDTVYCNSLRASLNKP